MAEAEEPALSISNLPELVQVHIFDYLSTAELVRCRRVSRAWRAAVDAGWRRRCALDHPEVCDSAWAKRSPDITTWLQLYRSLCLWDYPADRKYTVEMYRRRDWPDGMAFWGIRGMKVLNGQIIVSDQDSISYWNIEGDVIDEFSIGYNRRLVQYDENDNLIVYICASCDSCDDYHKKELRIIKKVNGKRDIEGKIEISDVEKFIIVGDYVYYNIDVKQNRRKESVLYCCRAKDNYASVELKTFSSQIYTYGCTNNRVNILLKSYEIFVQENNDFVEIDNFKSSNAVVMTRKYNFQQTHDFIYNTLKNPYFFHGDWVFVGDDCGTATKYGIDMILENPPDLDKNLKDLFKSGEVSVAKKVTSIDVIQKNNGKIIILTCPKSVFLAHWDNY